MATFAPSSPKPWSKILKFLFGITLTAGFLGFLDATYLTAKHYLGTLPPCYFGQECDRVLTSPYAVIFGIPLALLGSLYYLTILLLTVSYLDTKKEIIFKMLKIASVLGFSTSLLLLYLQAFPLQSFCSYCLFSTLTSTLIFLAAQIAGRGLNQKLT